MNESEWTIGAYTRRRDQYQEVQPSGEFHQGVQPSDEFHWRHRM